MPLRAPVIAVHGAHRFLGELTLLTGARAWLTAVVRDSGEVIQVPASRWRRFLASDEELGNMVLRAFLARREILIETEAGLRVIGSRFSRDTRRLREFLARNRIPHRFIDIEADAEAEHAVRSMRIDPRNCPSSPELAGCCVTRPTRSSRRRWGSAHAARRRRCATS